MPLRLNPWRRGFVYLCSRRPFGCRGLASAHPSGAPQGIPAPAEIRRARRFCHAVFDQLWKSAPALYRIQETEPSERHRAEQAIRRQARKRCYRWVAERLGLAEAEAHISRLADLGQLRDFYRLARGARMSEILEWAHEREAAEGRRGARKRA